MDGAGGGSYKKKLASYEIPVERDGDRNVLISGLDQREALVRYFFKIDPSDLSDEDFGRAWGQLEYALQFDGKLIKPEIKQG